jgi:outer membrane protein
MNKKMVAIWLVTAFMVIAGFSVSWAQAVKIAVYDSNRIFQESKTIAAYNAELSKSLSAGQTALSDKANGVNQLVEKLKKDGATMAAPEKRALEERINAENKELKRKKEDVDSELRKQQQGLREKAIAEILRAVRQVGEKEDYTLIMERRAAGVAYAKGSIDITAKILAIVK